MSGTTRNAPMDRDVQTAIQAMIDRALNNRVVATIDGKSVRGTVEIVTGDGVDIKVQGNKITISTK